MFIEFVGVPVEGGIYLVFIWYDFMVVVNVIVDDCNVKDCVKWGFYCGLMLVLSVVVMFCVVWL